jgi:alginate O-acetyltransferase complex protein AlgI
VPLFASSHSQTAEQLAAALKQQGVTRWAGELSYFRILHEWLPEPFFHTEGFLLFFAVVAGVYWAIPRRWNTGRVCLLVAASFHFYAAWNASLAFLVLGSATFDFLVARRIEAATGRTRTAWTAASVLSNLGLLAYFKYRGFFLGELHELLTGLGGDPSFSKLSPLDILVPFGISFYTFEAISYAVDVYRGTVRAERSLPHFLLFILFFPHLVAGPIVRAKDFLTQSRKVKRWNWVRVQLGVQFFLIGVFKKLAVADRMAQFSDPVLGDPEAASSGAIWLAVLAYSLRIYADFSGYSDMAVGLAHLLGYRLTPNFNMPYLAANVGEFWRRWHISLSNWLRDYVYIPLGGSRGGAWATDRNLMATMLLGGLWHGATWSYVVWGGVHGLLLVFHRHFRKFAVTRPGLTALLETRLGTAGRVALTFTAVSVAWVFFRPDLSQAVTILERMAAFDRPGSPLPLNARGLWYTALLLLVCHVAVASGLWQRVWSKLPPAAVGWSYAVLVIAAMLLAPEQGQGFIYFTF